MSSMEHTLKVGFVHACIAGDTRYTTVIDVCLDTRDGSVEVSRRENSATGGMDGDGRSDPFSVRQRVTIPKPTGALVVKAIKMVMDTTIKRYGKPTKNFAWTAFGERRIGLNAKNAQWVIDEYAVTAQGNVA